MGRAHPRAPGPPGPGDKQWQLQKHEADILHRAFGLPRHAADPRHLDLSDHAELREQVVRLDEDPALRNRR
ncbi:hypothetical protein [Streptomyces globisporus]|uniref:hypothetical protein n=1 Tax=Streptomyces globisporus TaxID=1908 RepID=UPI0036A4C03E